MKLVNRDEVVRGATLGAEGVLSDGWRTDSPGVRAIGA